jgi:hypothetical protein
MDRGLLTTVLAIAVLLIAAIGCGEKDEPATTAAGTSTTAASTTASSTTTTTAADGPLTAAGYVKAADELCSTAMADQEDLRRERGGKQITLRDRARLLVQLAPVRVRLAEELAGLEPAARQQRAAAALVATARSRGEASTEAGKLFQNHGSHEAIAAAAAAEHDEREGFVVIAGRLGMAECAEVLPPSDVRAVTASVEQGLGNPHAAKRCAVTGQRYLDELYEGGLKECAAAGSGGWDITDVEVSGVRGMAGVFAEARADVTGGGVTRHYRVRLTYEDGTYKIDKLD